LAISASLDLRLADTRSSNVALGSLIFKRKIAGFIEFLNETIYFFVIHYGSHKEAPLKSRSKLNLVRQNVSVAMRLYDGISKSQLMVLRDLTATLNLSICRGELLQIDGKWYVSHSGLIRIAHRRRCCGIETNVEQQMSDASAGRWVFKAAVRTSPSKIFVGYGDADPSNVSFLVHGAEMRVAETRAVNRALRKAYGIGICSVEEIGSFAEPPQTSRESKKLPPQPANGNNGGPKVRDRLCQVIRQHQLDPNLVKAYATDFCGVKTLREATREQVENFVTHLADWAEKDRNALLCQLNSYPREKEGAA
jgi:hypothetical protein